MLKTLTIAPIAALFLATACAAATPDTPSQDNARGESPRGDDRRGPPKMDLSEAASKLGITEEALEEAMKKAGGPPPDLDKVAEELGVTKEALEEALPPPPRRR